MNNKVHENIFNTIDRKSAAIVTEPYNTNVKMHMYPVGDITVKIVFGSKWINDCSTCQKLREENT